MVLFIILHNSMIVGNNCTVHFNKEANNMAMKMGQIPVKKILLNSQAVSNEGEFEFIIDCESVYFNALYDNDGNLQYVDQYFYTENHSYDAMERAAAEHELLSVDNNDFPVKSYLLAKQEQGNEWMRFHAVVPKVVSPDYFHQKYLGE
jgi:hypothetical protein